MEAALIRRAQSGDRAAFDQLAQRYRAVLRALAFLRTSDLSEAEDLAQVVLTRAWQKLPTLQDPTLFLPWLKAIVANACNSWYRQSRTQRNVVDMETSSGLLAPARTMPLEAALAREKQRELRQALVALPEANRIALLMHVWGGYSYEDIAAFTGVRVTTVEGRIYRARRQLQQLLRDSGIAFLGEASRSSKMPAHQKIELRQRKKIMAKTPTQPETNDLSPEMAQALTLVLFSNRFSALIDCGVSLVRALLALEEMPVPYGEAAREVREKVERGDTLSRAMRERPELFPNLYCALIRAGEVGGILEETLSRANRLMSKEWELTRRRLGSEEALLFALPPNKAPSKDWDEFSAYQRTATLLLFCETFGILLVSGVPILQAVEIVAELLPPTPRLGFLEAREAIRQGERVIPSLERMQILPRFVIAMIAVGEEAGSLDTVLHRAAEVFAHELESRALED